MAQQERLSRIDAAWLRMDRPTNQMMICGVKTFQEQLSLQQLKGLVRVRLLAFHRFRQHIVDCGLYAYWEIDPDFDLNWHLRQIALPGDAGNEVLEEGSVT